MIRDQLPTLIGLGAWLSFAIVMLARQRLGRAGYLKLALLWTAIIGTTWALTTFYYRHFT